LRISQVFFFILVPPCIIDLLKSILFNSTIPSRPNKQNLESLEKQDAFNSTIQLAATKDALVY